MNKKEKEGEILPNSLLIQPGYFKTFPLSLVSELSQSESNPRKARVDHILPLDDLQSRDLRFELSKTSHHRIYQLSKAFGRLKPSFFSI